jgi:hypothetical protein
MSCALRQGLGKWFLTLKQIGRDPNVIGLEKWVDVLLYFSRIISFSQWMSFCFAGARETPEDKNCDVMIVDFYVIAKTLAVA